MSCIDDASFEYVQRLMRDRVGFIVDDDRRYLVEARLSPLGLELGCESYSDLVRAARSDATGRVLQRVLDAMLNGETTFFRDVGCFESLERQIVPELLVKRGRVRRLRIWCAAASTGQEPYSVAMLLRSRFHELDGWDVEILATDASDAHLARARDARYSQFEVNRGLPARALVRWFEQEGNVWVLCSDIRRRVRFASRNLVEPWPDDEPFDIVLLRNVMIYWPLELQRTVLGKVWDALADDGYLILGSAETTYYIDARYRRHGADTSCCFVKSERSL